MNPSNSNANNNSNEIKTLSPPPPKVSQLNKQHLKKHQQSNKPTPTKTPNLTSKKSFLYPNKREKNKSFLLAEEFSGFETDDNIQQLISSSSNKRGHVSLTHLLNFSFPPRQSSSNPSYAYSKGRKSYSTSNGFFSKERFVNANYRFVLKLHDDEGCEIDYSSLLVDPDQLVTWENVVQVIIPTPTEQTCPICLNPPIAPKMTKCGHVFCLTCLSHYLSLPPIKSKRDDDEKLKKWRKCPICFDAIYHKDLKSVRYISVLNVYKSTRDNSTSHKPSPSSPIRLKLSLMKRAINSTVIFPRNFFQGNDHKPPRVDNPYALLFSRVLLDEHGDYYKSVLQGELQELDAFIDDDDYGFGNVCKSLICEELERVNLETPQNSIAAKPSNRKPSLSSPKTQFVSPVILSPELSSKPDAYYFYQSSDGQLLFLHPLDIKILKHAYGSYQNFPDRLDVDVIFLSESTLDGELRSKFKFLDHLPKACDVGFVEVDWTGILDPEILGIFNKEITQRIQKHVQKDRKDEQAKRKFQAKQHQQLYPTPQPYTPSPPSDDFFPILSSEATSLGTSPNVGSWIGPSFASALSSGYVHNDPGRFRVLYNGDESRGGSEDEGGVKLDDQGWVLDLDFEKTESTNIEVQKSLYSSLASKASAANLTDNVDVSAQQKAGKKKGKKKGFLVVSNSGSRRY